MSDDRERAVPHGTGADVPEPEDGGGDPVVDASAAIETTEETPSEGAGVDEAVIEAFEAELAEARRQSDENWDRYLRAEADLDNLRRRSVRVREEAVAGQRRELLARFLDVADNLERALSFADSDPAALTDGLEGTYRDLSRLLTREGVEPIQAMDAPFDPELHEAVATVPLPDTTEERVVAVDRTGYTLDGGLLRPARVVVGQPAEVFPVGDGGDGGDDDQ